MLNFRTLSFSITALMLPIQLVAAGLEPINDVELASVTARDGIVVELGVYWNTDADGAPRTDIPEVERRFGFQYDGRPGDWLMGTNFYLYLDVPELALDAGYSPDNYNDVPGHPGQSDLLGSFDPYGIPIMELRFREPVMIGMNNEIAITQDVVSGGDVTAYGWERTDLEPFIGLKIGDSSNIPGQSVPATGTGTGPTAMRIDGTVNFFGYGAE